ncbi:MAG TPA: hypothetical protein PLQ29_08690 [Spirochaetales bacterium]|nr:hypothetical protein [Spirochaetales bacterium]
MVGTELVTIRDFERYLVQQGASKHTAMVAASVAWRQLEPEPAETRALCAYVLGETLAACLAERRPSN